MEPLEGALPQSEPDNKTRERTAAHVNVNVCGSSHGFSYVLRICGRPGEQAPECGHYTKNAGYLY
jgi:hypothetical protein